MTSVESNDSNAVEVGGIQFETLVPVLTVLAKRHNVTTPVRFGIRVTNMEPTPYRFIFFSLLPELLTEDGKAIERDYGRNATKAPAESDYLLSLPGESFTFFMDAELYWYNCQLQLRGYEDSGGVWHFQNLKPALYRVRFTYESSYPIGKIEAGRKPWKFSEKLWMGKVSTPPVEFRIVQT